VIRKFLPLLLAALPLFAQDAPPQLFLERIEVRNHRRVSPDVVIAESRLREGRTYSEAELRDASTRLSRLPFLLSVDFALEKGSERGRYVLVLTVQETKPFFFLLDGQPYFDAQNGPIIADDDHRGLSAAGENLALGFRWFVGRRGAVHVGLAAGERSRPFANEYGAFAVGYTQYDLFGTRAFATLNVKKPFGGAGIGGISPELVVGVPVSANQTVTLQYDEVRFVRNESSTVPLRRGFGQRLVTMRWAYNTTNEPFFPTRGTLVHAGPVVGWTDGSGIQHVTTGGPQSFAYHTRFAGMEGGAARYFELSERNSVWADVRGDWARNAYRNNLGESERQTSLYGSVGAGFSHSLWTVEERANGDSRFEVTARMSRRSRRLALESVVFEAPDQDVRQVGAAWVRRSSWGTLRLGAGFAW
jgi:hypothetical protein